MKEFEKIPLDKLKPYPKNARTHSDEQIEMIAASIREFGFVAPVIIDENNMILVGHGRCEAARRAGMNVVPCRRVFDLSEDQKRAYIIADNKLSDLGEWDVDLLQSEIADIDIDLSDFGVEEITFDYKEKEPSNQRTINAYNMGLIDYDNLTNDFWQMPVIENNHFVPEDLIRFKDALQSKEFNCGVHFYIDDYQFERIWTYPDRYIDLLSKFTCILSPDFSLYIDMPQPMKIWNVYRSRQMGAFYQSKGIKVIPSVEWGEPETYDYCFAGIPRGSVVAVSPVSCKSDLWLTRIWTDGYEEMKRRIDPEAILIYDGEDFDYDYGDNVKHYKNNRLEIGRKMSLDRRQEEKRGDV